MKMKILSISDVITNSSSEVFVIHAKPKFQDEVNQEIPELLEEMCNLTGLDLNETMKFEIADESKINSDWGYHVAKKDLLIHSCEDNSIPGWLMDFIEDLWCISKFKGKFQGYFAKDLGEMPYYDWDAPYDERYDTKTVPIPSIQRRHLG